jgi:hypothetical protein
MSDSVAREFTEIVLSAKTVEEFWFFVAGSVLE